MSDVTHFASSVAYDALAAYMLLVWLLLLLLLLLLLDGEIASHKGTQLFSKCHFKYFPAVKISGSEFAKPYSVSLWGWIVFPFELFNQKVEKNGIDISDLRTDGPCPLSKDIISRQNIVHCPRPQSTILFLLCEQSEWWFRFCEEEKIFLIVWWQDRILRDEKSALLLGFTFQQTF